MTPDAPSQDSWYATTRTPLSNVASLESAITGGTKSAVQALLTQIEQEVAASPEHAFAFNGDGTATLTAAGHTYTAGKFSTPSIADLRARLESRRAQKLAPGQLRLSALLGVHPLTDIGTLQATAPEGVLFQAASQFNCLEAPGPRIVPVRQYVSDPTQGPRASVSAFPGTFLRHYRAPSADGRRFVQTDDDCINLLGGVFDPSVAEVNSGYLQVANVHDPA
ncbi:MAG TPA: hypothetical protein VNO21_18830, partial [Polyangiaceae bacterium]|nr:hypothetical protein [Polyangiaceae bacterium]